MSAMPTLTLSAYQDAASATADPRAYDLEYLIPALVGEAGEMVGQTAKAYWHGWSADRLQTELISEFGDVCWITAILLKRSSVAVVMPSYEGRMQTGYSALERITRVASSIYTLHSIEAHAAVVDSAERLWHILKATCFEVTGVEFDEVLQANLAKLADRAARGVLQGAGDHR